MDGIIYFFRDKISGTYYFIYALVLSILMFAIIGYLLKEKYGKLEIKLATSQDNANNKYNGKEEKNKGKKKLKNSKINYQNTITTNTQGNNLNINNNVNTLDSKESIKNNPNVNNLTNSIPTEVVNNGLTSSIPSNTSVNTNIPITVEEPITQPNVIEPKKDNNPVPIPNITLEPTPIPKPIPNTETNNNNVELINESEIQPEETII